MTNKHMGFSNSIVMKELEKLAYKKKLVSFDEEKAPEMEKKAGTVLRSNDDVFMDVITLASALRERGFVKQAVVLETKALEFKKYAEDQSNPYSWWGEEGDSFLSHAHPEKEVNLPSGNDYGLVEDLVEAKARIMTSVNKQPTGKTANLDAKKLVLRAIRVLAQDGEEAAELPEEAGSTLDEEEDIPEGSKLPQVNEAKASLSESIVALSEFLGGDFKEAAAAIKLNGHQIFPGNETVYAYAAKNNKDLPGLINKYNYWMTISLNMRGSELYQTLQAALASAGGKFQNISLSPTSINIINAFEKTFKTGTGSAIISAVNNYKNIEEQLSKLSAEDKEKAQAGGGQYENLKLVAQTIASLTEKFINTLPENIQSKLGDKINQITTSVVNAVLADIKKLQATASKLANIVKTKNLSSNGFVNMQEAESLAGTVKNFINRLSNSKSVPVNVLQSVDPDYTKGIVSNYDNYYKVMQESGQQMTGGVALDENQINQIKADAAALREVYNKKIQTNLTEDQLAALAAADKDIKLFFGLHKILSGNKDKSFAYLKATYPSYFKNYDLDTLKATIETFHNNVQGAIKSWASVENEGLLKKAAVNPYANPAKPGAAGGAAPAGGVGKGQPSSGGGQSRYNSSISDADKQVLKNNIAYMQSEQQNFAEYMHQTKADQVAGANNTAKDSVRGANNDGVWGSNTQASLQTIQNVIDNDESLKRYVKGKIDPKSPNKSESAQQINKRIENNILVIRRALAIAGAPNYTRYVDEAYASKGYDSIPKNYTVPKEGDKASYAMVDNGIPISADNLRSLLGIKNYLLDNGYVATSTAGIEGE